MKASTPSSGEGGEALLSPQRPREAHCKVIDVIWRYTTLPGVPAGNLKGKLCRTFEEGSEATEESPKKGKRGWSKSKDVREYSGYN